MKLIFYKCGQMPFPPKPPSKGEEPGRDGLDLTPPDPLMKRASSSSTASATSVPAAKKPKKKSVPGLPLLKKELASLNPKQQLAMLVALASDDTIGVTKVRAVMPAPDLDKIMKVLEKKVRDINKAMGRYANGDAFCWGRAKGKNGAAVRALCADANRFRAAKNWDVAHEFATRALGVASDLPHWDSEANNAGRKKAAETLTKLREDAAAQMM
jgi:hypothetical protein